MKGCWLYVGNIRTDEFFYNGAVSAVLGIECIAISVQSTRLGEKLTTILSIVSPTFADQHGIAIIKSVCVAIHGLVNCFVVVPSLRFKGGLRSTARTRWTVHVLQAKKGTKQRDLFTRSVCCCIMALAPRFRFFRRGASTLLSCFPHHLKRVLEKSDTQQGLYHFVSHEGSSVCLLRSL